MKRALAALLAILILSGMSVSAAVSSYSGDGVPPPPQISAAAAMVVDLNSGETIYDKDSDVQIYPASTVKIMTALLALEAFNGDFTAQITASAKAVSLTMGNSISAAAGETFTAEQLLYALMIYGANDAANILAEKISGSVDDFVMKMNKRALELGCANTVFANPTGLDAASAHTTAADIEKIAAYAATLPNFLDITSAQRYTIPATNKTPKERGLYNRNHFVSNAYTSQYFYPSAKGINAGSTALAGYCLVTTAESGGIRYLCVILGDTDTKIPGTDMVRVNSFGSAKALLDWAFTLFENKVLLTTGDVIYETQVRMAASKDYVGLTPDKEIDAILPVSADITRDIERSYKIFDEKLEAPVEKGEILGEIYLSYGDRILGQANLVANAQVERSNILYNLNLIRKFLSTRQFMASAAAFIVLSALYFLGTALGAGKNKRW